MNEFSTVVEKIGMDLTLLAVIKDLAGRRDARKDLAYEASMREPDCEECRRQAVMSSKYGIAISAVKDLRYALAKEAGK